MCLDGYNIQAIYQKTGFLLEHYMHEMQLPQDFIDYCKSKKGKSTRYLLKKPIQNAIYNSEWQLIVPEGIFDITDEVGAIDTFPRENKKPSDGSMEN